MQIVIDISEAHYKTLQMMSDIGLGYYHRAILNGTPLPRGHGRLKDIDEIEWYGCTTEYECPYKNRDCKDCDRAECSKTQVDSIPTIIPADKERD